MTGPVINLNKMRKERSSIKEISSSQWFTGLAYGFSFLGCVFYSTLYILIPRYRQLLESRIDEIPLSIRIILNIYQPYLVVFILISIALMILLYLKRKQKAGKLLLVYMLIGFNFFFSMSLLVITFAGLT